MIKNKTLFIVKEELSVVFIFFIITWLNLLASKTDDLPLLRSIIGTLFLTSTMIFYDIFLLRKLIKHLGSILFILSTLVYYYITFFVMLILYGYVNLIFKSGYSVNSALKADIFKLYPMGIHEIVFYLILLVTIRHIVKEVKTRSLRGVTKNFICGNPKEYTSDVKIFMFMDLKSSTTYAEKLGHKRYSKFICDIYAEIDEYVLATKGNIYQYVGDEVVVVWNFETGIKNDNFLKLYLLFEKRLIELKDYFIETYAIFPQFKAGFHVGEVAIAEVGDILKREIAFHGDVVNTTARICSLCGELQERLLISEDLINSLDEKSLVKNTSVPIGNFQLKGKKKEVLIYKFSQNSKA